MTTTKRQRNKGTGGIREFGPDLYELAYDLGKDPATGKRRQRFKRFHGNHKQAEAELRRIKREVDTGTHIQPTKLTVSAYLIEWFEGHRVRVRAKTAQEYEKILRRHIIPALGAIPLDQLQPPRIQAYYTKKLTSGRLDKKLGGLSAQTVHSHHVLLNEALDHAMRMGLMYRNPCQLVDAPKPKKNPMKPLAIGDVHKFLLAAEGTMWQSLFALEIHTGLRRSELLALRWSDVELDFLELRVVEVMHVLTGRRKCPDCRESGEICAKHLVFNSPKSEKSRRTIALTPESAIALRLHRERQEALWQAGGAKLMPETRVFARVETGLPPLPDSLSHAFTRIAKKAGMPDVSLHSLRGTHVSLLARSGVPVKVLQERLGHADPGTTIKHYVHADQNDHKEAAQKFQEIMGRPAPKRG